MRGDNNCARFQEIISSWMNSLRMLPSEGWCVSALFLLMFIRTAPYTFKLNSSSFLLNLCIFKGVCCSFIFFNNLANTSLYFKYISYFSFFLTCYSYLYFNISAIAHDDCPVHMHCCNQYNWFVKSICQIYILSVKDGNFSIENLCKKKDLCWFSLKKQDCVS